MTKIPSSSEPSSVNTQETSSRAQVTSPREVTNKITGSTNLANTATPNPQVNNLATHLQSDTPHSASDSSAPVNRPTSVEKSFISGEILNKLIHIEQPQKVAISYQNSSHQQASKLIANINGQSYQIITDNQVKQVLQQSQQVIINLQAAQQLNHDKVQYLNQAMQTPPPVAAQSQPALSPIQSQLILLAQAIQLKMPSSLMSLAAQNGVDTEQLAKLASRPQGYPLPNATIQNKTLSFIDGPSIKLDTALNKGQYMARINNVNQQLVLTLTPIKAQVTVNLTPITQGPNHQIDLVHLVLSKPETSQILSQLFKQLEKTPLASPNGKQIQTSTILKGETPSHNLQQNRNQSLNESQNQSQIQNQSQTNTPLSNKSSNTSDNSIINKAKLVAASNTLQTQAAKQSPSTPEQQIVLSTHTTDKSAKVELAPLEVLQKALSKAGAMPITVEKIALSQQNLASALLKVLPELNPTPLTRLAEPSQLINELHSLAGLNLASTQSVISTPTLQSGGAITTLFQLLLGVKVQANHQKVSPALQQHLTQLQSKLAAKASGITGLNSILGLLDKANSLDTVTTLAQSMNIYQQVSTTSEQAATWYFALPYTVSQRNEQFEGKFESSTEEENGENSGWRLQLKFNLSMGSILVIAHKKGETLDLQFKGNSQQLLDKIGRFNDALSSKINQIGFKVGGISTQIAAIPPTLLPGDHFLVKTRA